MRGILITLNAVDQTGVQLATPSIEVVSHAADDETGCSLEEALTYIRDDERHNINVDIADAPGDERGIHETKLIEIEQLAWPQPDAFGQRTLSSIWAGSLSDGGYDYRFIPVPI